MTFKEIRQSSGMGMKQFSDCFNIPYRTIQDWEYEKRKCPPYVLELIQYKLEHEKQKSE
jgi:DNA-binding transcriptional regulator YiaG